MQVTETLNEGLRRAYTITVPAADLDAQVRAKLEEVQPEVAMKGFRKGKVPMALLRKQHGTRLLGEVLQEAVDGAISSHMEATGDRPAMQPQVSQSNREGWKEGDDVVIEVSYETLPDVPEVDVAALALTRLKVEADEAAVEEAVARLADQAKTFEDREAGARAEEGDQVVLDFVGRIDGEPFEGGAGTDHPLVLGSGSFIPGFEEGLVGVAAGDDAEVAVAFPEGYGAAHLAGREAVFSCTIKAVRRPVAAEVDDGLAKRFGAEDVAGLRAQIAERIAQEYDSAARQVAKRQLLDVLDREVSFDLPPSLVDAEASQVAHQLWHEENPHEHGHDHDRIEATDEHRSLAERRVKLGLLLADIGQKAEVRVTDQELTQAILSQARQYRGQERQFFEYVQKNPAVRQQIQAPLYEDKVVDHVFATAQVEERPATKDELQQAVDALDEL